MLIHFTTVHQRTDIRIRMKQVRTLADQFRSDVGLYVQDGEGDEAADGYSIVDTGKPAQSRFVRMMTGGFRMYRAIRKASPQLAHFHDPELLPWAVLLQRSGIKTIYDAHEDLPAAIMSKPYIRPFFRRPLSALVRTIEQALASRMDAVVAATPSIERNFSGLNTALLQNFPLLTELRAPAPSSYGGRPPHFAYVGGITAIRSAVEMVEAVNLVKSEDIRLQMAGSASQSLRERLEALDGWSRVIAHGWAGRTKVAQILSRCRAGLVLFHPEPNHVESQPNKLFEYMASGLPVIASDFPLWRNMVEEVGCGLLVDPQDPQAIADAMQWMLDHPGEAAQMGQRGRAAVAKSFNWETESGKLVNLYERLLSDI